MREGLLLFGLVGAFTVAGSFGSRYTSYRKLAFGRCLFSTKPCPCNVQRLFSAVKIETFVGGGSIEYPQSMFWSKNKKKK